MLREQLLGTWRLLSRETHYSGGTVSHAYGTHLVGQLMYDSNGNMSVAYMRGDRPRFVAQDKFDGTPAEVKAAFDGFQAYFGTFAVNEEKRTVTHHVAGSLFPNWEGTAQTRFVEIAGDRLTLRTPPISTGDTSSFAVLVWQRQS